MNPDLGDRPVNRETDPVHPVIPSNVTAMLAGTHTDKIGSVMVVGGGIAGMQASLDLANAGFLVYLVESRPSIGGVMAQLDKTFPTNDCSTCIISPKLIETAKHPNIRILAYSEVLNVDGPPGRYRVKVLRKARYVDEAKCVACGVCADKCPRKVPNAFNRGLDRRKAVYLSFTQAVPAVYTIDRQNCIYFEKGKCRACEKFCDSGAIDFGQQDTVAEIETGAIVLAPGFEPTDPRLRPEFGYGRYPNVVTGIEFERMLSAAGPWEGHVQRPSDGRPPLRIGWVQCVCSRDASIQKDYCSYACCMYAVKQAVIAREHDGRIEPTLFYMDIRAQGKGFDRYYERARGLHGVRFVRSMISRIVEDPVTRDLAVHYLDEGGEFRDETFDLMVLSVGFAPHPESRSLAERAGIAVDAFGFCESRPFHTVSTSRNGVFACGVFQGPKDIPDSVVEASGAAAEAMGLLAEARGTLVSEETYPEERLTVGEEPRIGVFVCHCGNNIAGVVNVDDVTAYARTLPHVVFADHLLFTCSTDSQRRMQEIIAGRALNRVVVASCSPRTHEPLFQDTIRKAGLNKYLVEMANIRDQCSWVHAADPEKATEKAKDLVRMSIARSGLLEPLHDLPFDVVQRCLVIGGGIAGMTAALNLADQGLQVVLAEGTAELGGNALKLRSGPRGEDVQAYLGSTVASVQAHPRIQVLTGAAVQGIEGHVGKFKSRIAHSAGETTVEHGAVIVAIGGKEHRPEGYLYGESPRVWTQREFHLRLNGPEGLPDGTGCVAMIQCVGSRDEAHPYCSRICCTQAVTNALRVKEARPDTRVYVLYRDVRTFGLYETLYRKAREAGVQFVRYDPESPPRVTEEGDRIRIEVMDRNLREPLEIEADHLVLSVAVRPADTAVDLAGALKLPLDPDGFFLEAHVKLRPLDFANAGMFLCGLAHGPKFLDESIAQAKGAAARAAAILSRKQMMAGGEVAVIDRDNCVVCLTCVRSCPFGVPKVAGDGFVDIDPAECHGCGICAGACPRKLIQVRHMRDDQIIAKETAVCS